MFIVVMHLALYLPKLQVGYELVDDRQVYFAGCRLQVAG